MRIIFKKEEVERYKEMAGVHDRLYTAKGVQDDLRLKNANQMISITQLREMNTQLSEVIAKSAEELFKYHNVINNICDVLEGGVVVTRMPRDTPNPEIYAHNDVVENP